MTIRNFILTDNNQSKFKLKDYLGKNNLLLIFFRGAWCHVCKKQLTDVQANLAKFTKLKYKPLAISNDDRLKSSLLKNFLKIKFPVIADEKMKLIHYFGLPTTYRKKITSKPAIFLFNNKLQLLYRYVGKKYDDHLEAKNIIRIIKKTTK